MGRRRTRDLFTPCSHNPKKRGTPKGCLFPYQNTLKNYSFTIEETIIAPKDSAWRKFSRYLFITNSLAAENRLLTVVKLDLSLFFGDARDQAGFAHLQTQQVEAGRDAGQDQRQGVDSRTHGHGLGGDGAAQHVGNAQ